MLKSPNGLIIANRARAHTSARRRGCRCCKCFMSFEGKIIMNSCRSSRTDKQAGRRGQMQIGFDLAATTDRINTKEQEKEEKEKKNVDKEKWAA